MFWRKKSKKETIEETTANQANESHISENDTIDIRDIEEAIEHYKSTPSEVTLLYEAGMAYLNGEYNAVLDKAKALQFFNRAGNLGHAESQYKAGQLYMLKGLDNDDRLTFILGVTEIYEAFKKGCKEALEDLQDIAESGFFENVSSVEDLCAILEANSTV